MVSFLQVFQYWETRRAQGGRIDSHITGAHKFYVSQIPRFISLLPEWPVWVWALEFRASHLFNHSHPHPQGSWKNGLTPGGAQKLEPISSPQNQPCTLWQEINHEEKVFIPKMQGKFNIRKIYIDFINILEREELYDPDIVKDLDSWRDK